MDLLVEIPVLILTTYILLVVIRSIFKGFSNILSYCIIAIYVIQIVPLWAKVLFGTPNVYTHINVHNAMNDSFTCIIYAITMLFIVYSLYYFSKKLNIKKKSLDISYQISDFIPQVQLNASIRFIVNVVLFVLIFLPVIVCLLAPKPSIYLSFSYFYTQSYNPLDAVSLYHSSVVRIALYISFAGLCVSYMSRTHNKFTFFYYLAIFINTWIDGKRTLMLFMMAGILLIDLLRGEYNNRRIHQTLKTIIMVVIVFVYFKIYNQLTGKGVYYEFYSLYTFYFSRMSIVETSIYDKLYTNTMLDFPLQTILFNLLVWVPRDQWPTKPVMYCIYFTSFADATKSRMPYNLQVNIIAEFISNFGIVVGPICIVLFLYYIAKKSELSNSKIIYLVGMIFCILYLMYGFEHIVMMCFYIWVALRIMFWVKKHVRIGKHL